MENEENGFDTIVDEEEDVFDEDNEEDDDDALSSSPSIPDDVKPSINALVYCKAHANLCRTSTSTLCMLSIHSLPRSRARQMPPKATCSSFSTTLTATGGSCALSKMRP